jgi:N utilization substance protein B
MTQKSARPLSAAARRKSAARLAAVQALYQIDLTGATPDQVLTDILQHGIAATALRSETNEFDEEREIETRLMEPDGELLTGVVRGALARLDQIDEMVAGALSREWSMERLEAVLRAILRAGACELSGRNDIPPKVTISEYVDVAHAFYTGSEPGLVNAVLDRIARVVRTEELKGKTE